MMVRWWWMSLALLLVSGNASAHFEEIFRERLRTQYLQELNSPLLAKRLQATSAFLEHPEWGLPVLREAVYAPPTPDHLWRVVQLLGSIGSDQDLELVLNNVRAEDLGTRAALWKATVQRLYLTHHEPQAAQLTLAGLEFQEPQLSKQGKTFQLEGRLAYTLQNPGTEPLLFEVQLDTWRSQLQAPTAFDVQWLPEGASRTFQVPVTLEVRAGFFYVRMDFRLRNLANGDVFEHQTLRVPLPGATSSTAQ